MGSKTGQQLLAILSTRLVQSFQSYLSLPPKNISILTGCFVRAGMMEERGRRRIARFEIVGR